MVNQRCLTSTATIVHYSTYANQCQANSTQSFLSAGASVHVSFSTNSPLLQHGCHVMEGLRSIGEELHHEENITLLVVKQVSKDSVLHVCISEFLLS